MSDRKRSDEVAEQLEAACAEHCQWLKRFDDYGGNNPSRYQKQIQRAGQKVRRLEGLLRYLRERGE